MSLFLVIGPTSFFETVFSSYVSACSWHCSFCFFDSPLLLGVLLLPAMFFCLLLAMLFCLFVPLSEILVDLLVVVQVLRLCAPFRQCGVASFADFFSPLTLLAVMVSLFSLFWRRFLQLYLVVVYCSENRLLHLPRHTQLASLRDHWFAVSARAPLTVLYNNVVCRV